MKINIELSMILAMGILGLLLLGTGFTGKVILNDTSVKKLCESNSDCTSNEACCKFYQKNSGVCDEPMLCDAITKLTINENSIPQIENAGEKSQTEPFSQELFFGFMLLVVFFLMLYIYAKQNRKLKNIELKVNKTKKRVKHRK